MSLLFIGHSPGDNMMQYSNTNSLVLMNKTERPVYGRQPGKFISAASSTMQSKSPVMTPSITIMNKSANNNPALFTGVGASAGQSSSMIEKEKRALEKIKARQRKEVE